MSNEIGTNAKILDVGNGTEEGTSADIDSTPESRPPPNTKLTRRKFLKLSALAGVGAMLGFGVTLKSDTASHGGKSEKFKPFEFDQDHLSDWLEQLSPSQVSIHKFVYPKSAAHPNMSQEIHTIEDNLNIVEDYLKYRVPDSLFNNEELTEQEKVLAEMSSMLALNLVRSTHIQGAGKAFLIENNGLYIGTAGHVAHNSKTGSMLVEMAPRERQPSFSISFLRLNVQDFTPYTGTEDKDVRPISFVRLPKNIQNEITERQKQILVEPTGGLRFADPDTINQMLETTRNHDNNLGRAGIIYPPTGEIVKMEFLGTHYGTTSDGRDTLNAFMYKIQGDESVCAGFSGCGVMELDIHGHPTNRLLGTVSTIFENGKDFLQIENKHYPNLPCSKGVVVKPPIARKVAVPL